MISYDFTDKNVVITGTSRGLGKACAQAITRRHGNVVLLGRNALTLDDVAQEIPKEQVIDSLAVDLSQSDQIATTYHSLIEKISHVDLLINNAAGWLTGSIEELSDEQIAQVIATTITGSLLITKHLLPLLKKGINPHIINVISTSGLPDYDIDPTIASVPYFAAKWGQTGFSEALRGEVKKEGVRVTSLYPGAFDNTSSLDDTKNSYEEEVLGVKDVVDAILFCATRPTVHSMTIKA